MLLRMNVKSGKQALAMPWSNRSGSHLVSNSQTVSARLQKHSNDGEELHRRSDNEVTKLVESAYLALACC